MRSVLTSISHQWFLLIGTLLVSVIPACQPPAEVQVIEPETGVDVFPLRLADTTFGLSPIDSSALMPPDQISYDGSFIVNNLRHDTGKQVFSASIAKVFVGDRNRPITSSSGTIGYNGFNLGAVFLNDVQLIRRPHFVPGVDTVVIAGFEYVHPPTFTYEPGLEYSWSLDNIEGPSVSVLAPGLVTVDAPKGGSFVSMDRPLELIWRSDGEVDIVVSILGRFGRPVPMLRLRPWSKGYALVPAKVLRLLPRDHSYFLTFIEANRSEIQVDREFLEGTILVQAASVYTTVIHLR